MIKENVMQKHLETHCRACLYKCMKFDTPFHDQLNLYLTCQYEFFLSKVDLYNFFRKSKSHFVCEPQ